MKKLDWLFGALLVIGGLNWGLVGLFNFNLVSALLGEMSWISRIVYIVVGISALYEIVRGGQIASHFHAKHTPNHT